MVVTAILTALKGLGSSRITKFRCMVQSVLGMYVKRRISLQSVVRDKSFKAEVTHNIFILVYWHGHVSQWHRI